MDLHVGTIRRPVINPLTWANPWTSGRHLFVLTIPVCIGGFISAFIRIKQYTPGFYIGTKTYRYDYISATKDPNAEPKEWTWGYGPDELHNIYMAPSGTLRLNLVDRTKDKPARCEAP
jgi:hypothetical protein